MTLLCRSRHVSGMTLPQVRPIIPTWRKEPFDDPDWLLDLKYDGFRGLFHLPRGRGRFISRNSNILILFEALADQLAAILKIDEGAIIDGEVIVADETGSPQFYDLIRAREGARL